MGAREAAVSAVAAKEVAGRVAEELAAAAMGAAARAWGEVEMAAAATGVEVVATAAAARGLVAAARVDCMDRSSNACTNHC